MTVARKYKALRTVLLIVQGLSAVVMVLLILFGVLVAVTPQVNFITGETEAVYNLGGGIGFGALGVVQFLAVWLISSVISLMIERERNDRITHALLQRLLRSVEKEKQG